MRALCLALMVGVAGCGTSQDQECSDAATASCNLAHSCSTGFSILRSYGELATCVARAKDNCLRAAKAPGQGGTISSGEACVAAEANESCSDYYNNSPPSQCINIGSRANGQGCVYNGQCASGSCNGTKSAACGTCGPAPGVGDDCTTSACQHGLVCDGSTSRCIKAGGGGASCMRDSDCQTQFSCVGARALPTPTAGSCQPQAATVGAPCDPRRQTGPACAYNLGLWCNPQTNQCGQALLVGDGQPCGPNADGTRTDCKGGTCYGASFGANPTQGSCKAHAADGAACDTTNGPSCTPPARCVTSGGSTAGTCVLPDPTSCL